jgi:hypothetical protein
VEAGGVVGDLGRRGDREEKTTQRRRERREDLAAWRLGVRHLLESKKDLTQRRKGAKEVEQTVVFHGWLL